MFDCLEQLKLFAANPQDADSFYPGANGQKSYNLLHINAMYDLLQHIYVDAIIQKSRKTDESAALRLPLIIAPKPSTSSLLTKISRKSAIQAHCLREK